MEVALLRSRPENMPNGSSRLFSDHMVSETERGVPQCDHTTQPRIFIDPDLLQWPKGRVAARTCSNSFGAAPADVVRVAGGVVADVKLI